MGFQQKSIPQDCYQNRLRGNLKHLRTSSNIKLNFEQFLGEIKLKRNSIYNIKNKPNIVLDR